MTVLNVGYKLAQPEPPVPLLTVRRGASVGALIEEAKELLAQEGLAPDFSLIEDDAFQDADQEFLFRP